MVMIMLTNKYHPFGGVVLQVFVIILFVTSLWLREVNCTVDRNCARSRNEPCVEAVATCVVAQEV